MANLTTVGLTNGGGTSGTGNVSTLDNLIGTAGTANTNVLSVQGIASGVAQPVSGTVTASQATASSLNATVVQATAANLNCTEANSATIASSVLSQGSTTSGQKGELAMGAVTTSAPSYTTAQTSPLSLDTAGNLRVNVVTGGGSGGTSSTVGSAAPTTATAVGFSDGTNMQLGRIKAASTAPVASDPAIVVAISPNSVNANGRATPANSAPIVMASQVYNTVAASQTAQALTGGGGGATGDWLDFLLIVPATTAAGAVSIKDGSGSAITVWAGGGTTALVSLVPFSVPIRAVSAAGAWSVTTGTNVSVIASGNFH